MALFFTASLMNVLRVHTLKLNSNLKIQASHIQVIHFNPQEHFIVFSWTFFTQTFHFWHFPVSAKSKTDQGAAVATATKGRPPMDLWTQLCSQGVGRSARALSTQSNAPPRAWPSWSSRWRLSFGNCHADDGRLLPPSPLIPGCTVSHVYSSLSIPVTSKSPDCCAMPRAFTFFPLYYPVAQPTPTPTGSRERKRDLTFSETHNTGRRSWLCSQGVRGASDDLLPDEKPGDMSLRFLFCRH